MAAENNLVELGKKLLSHNAVKLRFRDGSIGCGVLSLPGRSSHSHQVSAVKRSV